MSAKAPAAACSVSINVFDFPNEFITILMKELDL